MTNDRTDRHDRLRHALRENLKRRKAQVKGRAATVDSPADEASIEDGTAQPVEPADAKRQP